MTDTVARLMAVADSAIAAQDQRLGHLAQDYRQALEAELTRLFTPLSDEQIMVMCAGNNYAGTVPVVKRFARAVENIHGIGGES